MYRVLPRLAVSTACSILALTAGAAYAQQAPTPVAEEPAGEEIVVTGSRIARVGDESPNPIVEISGENLVEAGNVNIVDTLSQNPALLGSTRTTGSSGSNADFGAVGVNLLNLRNLGV